MEKDTLRNRLFESYFDETEGIIASNLVDKLSFIPQTWSKLHTLCQKNIEHFGIWSNLESFKMLEHNKKKYLILKLHLWNYVIIDLEDKKCLSRKQLQEEFTEDFFIENFNEEKIDTDFHFSRFYFTRTYYGDVQELIDFYIKNEATFNLPTRLSHRLGTKDAWTYFVIDFANAKGYMGFETPNQFLYEHLFLNYDLTASGMQDSQETIGIDKSIEMFKRIPSIKIPKGKIPEKLLIEYQKRSDQEIKEEKNIIELLNEIIQSGENTLIQINEEKKDTLEYGIIGMQMKEKSFNLEDKDIAELLYDGIYQIAPNSTITFMNVNAFGNQHSAIIIDINENVKVMIGNSTHRYDTFIENLKNLTEQESYVESDSKPAMYSKKIKPRIPNNK